MKQFIWGKSNPDSSLRPPSARNFSRFLPTRQPEIVHKQSLLTRVFSQEQTSAKVSRRRWPISSLIANKKNCHEIKMPAPWKKSYNKARQCIKKQRHHFADKGPYKQSYGFSSSHVWIWELGYKEGWALKNDAFELWCWRRLLRVLWTERRSNQSILKGNNPEYSLEGLMLKLQYFGHLMLRADSLEKTLDAGKDWGQEQRMTENEIVGWHHQLNGHEFEQAPGDGEGHRSLACYSMGSQRVGHVWATEQQQISCINIHN